MANCPDFSLYTIVPVKAKTIQRGDKMLYSAKIGGERKDVTVLASCAPYTKDIGNGRKSLYVDVFCPDGKWSVMASKLRRIEKISR